MIRVGTIAIAGFVLSICAPADEKLPAGDAVADVELARRAVLAIHPGWDRYTPAEEIQAAFDTVKRAAEIGLSRRDLFANLSLALAKLRCNHTKAEPWKEWTESRKSRPTYLPFRFATDGRRMVVIASAAEGIAPGDEILAIDGAATATILGTIYAAVPADGFTDDSRRFGLSDSSDLDECEFDHFYPFFFKLGDSAMLEARSPASPTARRVQVAAMTREQRRAALAMPAPAANLDEAVSLDFPRDDLAVLKVGTFVAYRKSIAPEAIYRPLFEKIRERKPRTLILDLRDNGGGSTQAAVDLLRFLLDAPSIARYRTWLRTADFSAFRDKLTTWDESVFSLDASGFRKLDHGLLETAATETALSPLDPAFTGRVIALIGPANASGSTLFLAALRERRGVTLVGEPTGGSAEGPTAGTILFLNLPASGIRVRIPVYRSVFERSQPAVGLGVSPDVRVETTIEDRVAKRDPVMQRALQLAGERGGE